MDLLLTHAYFLAADPHERQIMRPYPPLGLLYVSAFLKANDLDVGVYDTTFTNRGDFEQHVRQEQPAIVGIYANLMTRAAAVASIAACRSLGSIVVVGGPEPGNYAAEYLAAGADVVVEGEGELTMLELVPHLLEHGVAGLESINGIHYMGEVGDDSAVPRRTPPRAQIDDLDALPLPDREAIEIDQYIEVWRRHHGAGSVSMITARGCPYTCSWCSHGVFGFTHRRRSPANVADELEHIVERYRPDMVWYSDDVFTINHRWIHDYADELQRRGLHLPFETISREDRLDEAIIERLAAMGCRRLWVGAESGSQRVLDAMQRRTDASRVERIVRLLQQHGIEAGLFIMLGYDGEQISDIEATVQFLERAAPDQFVTTVAYPIKGTAYHDQVADRIVGGTQWATGSDRDLGVRGRHSDRFYRHATRWMVSEVARRQLRGGGPGTYTRQAKVYLNARLGRLGMLATRHERAGGDRHDER